jgi:integrase/recombinase XerD
LSLGSNGHQSGKGRQKAQKPAAKRSNRLLFIDKEAIRALSKWLQVRKTRKGPDGPALFVSHKGSRLGPDQVEWLVEKHASRVGLHDHESDRLEDRFGPHCCRHWFTTRLIRAGMPRDFVKEPREALLNVSLYSRYPSQIQ